MTEYSKETVKTYWAMMGVAYTKHDIEPVLMAPYPLYGTCQKCGETNLKLHCEHEWPSCPIPDPIPLSPAELAEYMMQQCDMNNYRRELFRLIPPIRSACWATPQQRIDAAVKAWKGTNLDIAPTEG